MSAFHLIANYMHLSGGNR